MSQRPGILLRVFFQIFFAFQFFKLNNFYWSILKFTDFFLYYLYSVQIIQWFFLKVLCIVFFFNSRTYSWFFYNFYFSAQVSYIFYRFFYAIEHNYNSFLKIIFCWLQHLGYLGLWWIVFFFLRTGCIFPFLHLIFIIFWTLYYYRDSGFYPSEDVYLGAGWAVVYFGFCLNQQLT